jgi:hypothetical protein
MTDRRLPDYLLERLALGELPEEAARQAEEQLAREPGGAQRLADLRASNAELLARHPPEAAAKEIARRHRAVAAPIRRRRVSWLAAPVVAFAVALLVVVLQPGDEQTRVKGDAALLVYRDRGGQSELLRNGDRARAGDEVQLAYARARPGYGVIVSLDGAGEVTLHLPEKDGEAVRLVPDARTPLPNAYGLDAAPHFERFFLVTSPSPFRASVAVEAARKLAARGDAARTDPLTLPVKFEQSSFLLLKTPNP